jgi:hypothetical protein
MALQTYVSAGVYDTHLGSATITATTAGLTLAGITSSGVTAPNLVNKITGVWICISTLPTNAGNITAEIMESGVSKKTATINLADAQLGMNYFRFATPYQFATLTASAYTCRLKNTVSTSGNVRTAASGLWFQFTYDTAGALGASDDLWVGGFNDAGLTTKTLTVTGTANTFGSKATTAIGSTTQTMGAALTVGSGGTFKHDTAASCTTTLKGSVWVTAGGVFDIRASATKSIVSTFIIDSTANGDQGIFSATGATGGQLLTTGATYDQYTRYASGTGTAADPLIVSVAWDAGVNDEIVIPGIAYNTNQIRFVKTRNSSTSFVLSATAGGAESAITNTPAVGSYIANLTRNSIIKPVTTTLGYYINNSSNTAGNFNYTRFEYSDNTSGKALTFSGGSTGGATSSFDGIVGYQTSITGGRHWLAFSGTGDPSTSTTTHTGITAYNTAGTNYIGQSGVGFQGTSNKTVNYLLHYNGSSTTTGAMLSLNGSSTGNIINNSHAYGTNGLASASGYAIGIFSSSSNTFNNCTVNACRTNAVYFAVGTGNTFNSCNFGTVATNTVDITSLSSTLNQAVFNNCSFGSATLISNYLNQLDTSSINFQDMDTNTSKHRWYTNKGSWWSSGTGLTDTTVRTASSLALVSKPENASTGSSWTFKIPANPTSAVGVFGYVYRNATFSSGTLKVELFLPGTLLTATPDDTYTFATTTGSWLPFNINAYYSGSVARYATVRITGVTATAGAYFFIDDLYDAGTGNKVAGLDLWDNGQPSEIMVQSDFSVVPAAVWGFSNANTQANTMGQDQVDARSNSDVTQAKVDTL